MSKPDHSHRLLSCIHRTNPSRESTNTFSVGRFWTQVHALLGLDIMDRVLLLAQRVIHRLISIYIDELCKYIVL